MIERKKLVQWLLDNGTGIVYTNDSAETTYAEENNKPFNAVRYVESELVDFFMGHTHSKQIEYAIEHNMSILDFDEWQAIQNVLFKNTVFESDEIPFEIASKINNALYEADISPLDLEPDPIEKNDVMTPEEMEGKVKEIYAEGYDEEAAHVKFDNLCEEVLRQLGYGKAMDALKELGVNRYYS